MTEFHGIDRRRFLAGAAAAGAVVPLAAMTPALAGATTPTAGPDKFPFPTDSSLRVLLTGDAGTGTPAQWAVTDAIRDLHGRAPLSMALGLGDNIYELGPNGDDDVQFKTKFEDPNHGLDFPWVMALGNHDNSAIFPGDGGWLLRGDDEVDYHQRSRKWWMPSRYLLGPRARAEPGRRVLRPRPQPARRLPPAAARAVLGSRRAVHERAARLAGRGARVVDGEVEDRRSPTTRT